MGSRDHDASAAILGEVVRRIVNTAQPLSIILFGSGPRRDVDSNSDFDAMVFWLGTCGSENDGCFGKSGLAALGVE